MYLTVYIDSLFLTNFFMDTAILLSVYIFKRRHGTLFRILAGAIISAVYGTLMFFPLMAFAYGVIGKVIVSAVIVFVSFKVYGLRDFFCSLVMFWITSVICGGIILAISVFTDFGTVMQTTVSNCVMYIKLNPFLLIAGCVLLYLSVEFYRRAYVRNFSRDKIILPIKVVYGKNNYNLSVLIDTGCELIDPLSRDPAMVADKRVFKNLQSIEDKIYIKTASGKGELSLIFPDKIECKSRCFNIRDKTPIALSDNRFSYDGLYDAVINPMAVEEVTKNESIKFNIYT